MTFLVLAIGVVFIIVAIAVLKIHPFLALLSAAFLVGVLSPVPPTMKDAVDAKRAELRSALDEGRISQQEFRERWKGLPEEVRRGWPDGGPGSQAVSALELTTRELGSTAASIAVVIALAAIIGQCLMESGAADKITRRLLAWLGEKRAGSAMMSSGYILSIPVFFDTVFFLLVPLARALRMRTGRNFVLYAMAMAAGAVVTHSLVPPTPGPLVMVDNLSDLGLELGTAIGIGFLLGLPPAVAGLYFAGWLNRRLDIPFRDAAGISSQELERVVKRPESDLPSFGLSIIPVALPVVLITGFTLLETLDSAGIISPGEWVLGWAAFVGNKNLALFAGAVFAAGLLAARLRLSLSQLRDRLEPAVLSAGVIILITSAGGAFGKMLARTGIDSALQESVGGGGLGTVAIVLLAWLLAGVMKLAQGSGTVAMITASGMMAGILGGSAVLPCHPVYVFAAIGFGSLMGSWMNDSGFWVVCKMSGFTEVETLKTWTPLLAVIGLAGLVEVLVLSLFLPLV